MPSGPFQSTALATLGYSSCSYGSNSSYQIPIPSNKMKETERMGVEGKGDKGYIPYIFREKFPHTISALHKLTEIL